LLKSALNFSHELLDEIVVEGDFVVDATMGRGNDTLKLARLVGESGRVLAFDVQVKAFEQTKFRLEEAKVLERVCLKLEGHENVGKYLEKNIRAAIFNLGYLPGSDKSVITRAQTTIRAVKSLMEHLCSGGRIILVVYHGHSGGSVEKNALLEFMDEISPEKFQVLQYQFVNQENSPPFLLAIEKK
jgi:16S rRNA C1402 N4-methylase RsmH